jgi:serine/threonine protein phosphatase PrpC
MHTEKLIRQNKAIILGSTLISAIFEQNRYLTVVNVGDSRAIACDKNGRVRLLSKDHKPSDVSCYIWEKGGPPSTNNLA